MPRSDRLAELVDAYLDAETENALRSARDGVLTRAKASLGAWSQEIIPHLASRFQEALDREPDDSRPNVEADALGRLLSSWNGLFMSAAFSGFPEAEAVIRELLSILRRNQQRLGHLHKGTPLHQLGWLRLPTDPAGATPYILAALVEDVIRDPEGFTRGPAAQVCVNVLGIDPSLFDDVKTFVTARVPGPDEVQALARSDPELPSLVRSMNDPPNNQLLRISLHYDPAIGDLLRGRMSTEAQGRIFELLIAYLMRTLGGFDTRGRVRALDSETDLILRDGTPKPSVLGDYVLVECKNWNKPVGAPAVKKFAQNVRAASCHSGIIATREGLTGGEEALRDAKYTIRRHYHREGIVLITLDVQDLDRLVSKRVSLSDLVVTKYEAIRFDEREIT